MFVALVLMRRHLRAGSIPEQRAGCSGRVILVQIQNVDTGPERLITWSSEQQSRVEREHAARSAQARRGYLG
jgi:hypothetical protein